jgi:predicted nuclease of predicted toxin-antitoxin system
LRVLFDKNVPYGARHFLSNHQVETVDDRGWARISNGELLQTAEAAGFEVVVTADQNIVYQQTLAGRKIALVILGSNIWPIVRHHEIAIREQVDAAVPGSYAFIEMPLPPKHKSAQ